MIIISAAMQLASSVHSAPLSLLCPQTTTGALTGLMILFYFIT